MRFLFNRVLVEPVLRKQSRGGIIIPDTATEHDTPCEGVVQAVGDGWNQNGVKVPMPVSVGDRVIVRKHAGKAVKWEGKDMRAIVIDDIDAVIEDEGEVVVEGMPR